MDFEKASPKLLASTSLKFSVSIFDTRFRDLDLDDVDRLNNGCRTDSIEDEETNYFKSMQWSPDGTCLLTNSADNNIRTFIPPADLLSSRPSPIILSPYYSASSPEPIYSLTPYPFFSLQDQSTTLVLSSPRDLPIRLSNALYPSILATYALISPTTEAFLTPSSLTWNPEGTHFLTGTDSLIALFDVSQPSSGPITRLPTIPSKRHKIKGGGVGMRGIISCLSLQPASAASSAASLLAAGTWTRWVSLYDAGGLGGTVANWSIASAADSDAKISGGGVSQTLWSPCGRYLFVVERKSRGVLIYDIRVTGRLVGWLEGRTAETNQRLGVEIFPYADADFAAEFWAGGTDGMAKVWRWKGIGDEDGGEGLSPSSKWQAHKSTVTSVAIHPSRTVVATSSGQRQDMEVVEDEDTDSENDVDDRESSTRSKRHSKVLRKPPDNSIKIWGL